MGHRISYVEGEARAGCSWCTVPVETNGGAASENDASPGRGEGDTPAIGGGDPTTSEAELRARISELESQLQQAERTAGARPQGRGARSHPAAWAVVSGILIILACLMAPLSVVAVWANTQVMDTDQYVRTVAPLAHDSGVQAAVAAEVTSAVLEAVDAEEFATELLDSVAERPNMPPRIAAALPSLAGPINGAVEDFVGAEVDRIVASDRFATLWSEGNRVAHDQVVRLLAGDRYGVVTAQDDAVTLNLGPIVAEVKQGLVGQGFGLASTIPEVDRSFVLVQSSAVATTQDAYRWLSVAGPWVPVVALLLFALGVLAAGDRRRAVLRGALGVVAAMLLAGIGLAVFSATYVASTPAGVLDPVVAGNVFDTLVHFLRVGIRAVAVLALIVAAVAYLSGPSAAARGSRSILEDTIARLRGDAEAAGWRTGRAGVWFHTHRVLLRTMVLVIGGFVVLFWPSPTAWVIVGVAAVVALVIAALEFLAQPPASPPPVSRDSDLDPALVGES